MVIAIVHLTGKGWETDWHERLYVDSLNTHTLEETLAHTPAAHIVVEHTHLYTLARLSYDGIGNKKAKCIVFKDIHIDMNMVTSIGNVAKQ